ncbi:MAG: hypothetical protein R3C53_27775 [Pirellulaceae bacterium]
MTGQASGEGIWWRKQSEFLGFGKTLRSSGIPLGRGSYGYPDHVIQAIADWAENDDALREHLCFLDIYYKPPASPVRQSLAVIVTPLHQESPERQARKYLATLRSFWQTDESLFASHLAFSLGLPLYKTDSGSLVLPRMEKELKEQHDDQFDAFAFLYSNLHDTDPRFGLGPADLANVEKEFETYSKSRGNRIFASKLDVFAEIASDDRTLKASSGTGIDVRWMGFAKAFATNKGEFTNRSGMPLQHLYAIPVTLQAAPRVEDASELLSNTFAIIFLGLSENASDTNVTKSREDWKSVETHILRYVYLQLNAANTSVNAARIGVARGKNIIQAAMKHETVRLLPLITAESIEVRKIVSLYLNLLFAEVLPDDHGLTPASTLSSLISWCWKKAVILEFAIKMQTSNVDAFTSTSEADFDELVNRAITQNMLVYDVEEAECFNLSLKNAPPNCNFVVAVGIALLAAFRNAIYHTLNRSQDNSGREYCIKIEQHERLKSGRILNFTNEFWQPDPRTKDEYLKEANENLRRSSWGTRKTIDELMPGIYQEGIATELSVEIVEVDDRRLKVRWSTRVWIPAKRCTDD